MWLVHIVKRRVKFIRIEWRRCEIWIHVRIERIVIVECHFTKKITNKKKKSNNKQKEKKNQNQANRRVDLDLDVDVPRGQRLFKFY